MHARLQMTLPSKWQHYCICVPQTICPPHVPPTMVACLLSSALIRLRAVLGCRQLAHPRPTLFASRQHRQQGTRTWQGSGGFGFSGYDANYQKNRSCLMFVQLLLGLAKDNFNTKRNRAAVPLLHCFIAHCRLPLACAAGVTCTMCVRIKTECTAR